jgi:NADP-dependent 3-hydroxy acid dehydrogenase YdfG
MNDLKGRVAWVTGAGSGNGAAAALAFAKAGASVALTGRRVEPLEIVAGKIRDGGGTAVVLTGDLMETATAGRIVAQIVAQFGRLDILLNNAGLNITARNWSTLTPEGVDQLVRGNLSSAFYCVTAVLPIMRAQSDGLLIHTASMSGRYIGVMAGPGYTAAKHGVVAMSHTINMEECVNGIRSTVICPGEVATPILALRPVPVSADDQAKMLQSDEVADMIMMVARLPKRVCINEVQMTPTWNRGYVALRNQAHVKL